MKQDKNKKKNNEEEKVDISEVQEVVEQASEIENLKKQNNEYLDKMQRLMAEFDNYKKRTVKEKASMYENGMLDTVEKLLPVVDNFERAMLSMENKEDVLFKGVEMIYRQLTNTLKDMEVLPIPSVGEVFDHNMHHGVSHIEDENYGEGVIVEELQKGYIRRDRVIRVSMVKVAN